MTDVKQSGLVTPGHLAEWATIGVLADSGTSVAEILEEATSPRTQRSVITTPIVIESTDEILNCNISSAATCLLPLAASRNGSPLTFQDLGQASAHNIVITASGGDLIDGLVSVTLSANYQNVTLVPFDDGVNIGWTIDPLGNGGITVGAPVIGGTPGLFFYDNAGVVGMTSAGGGGSTAGAFASITSLAASGVPASTPAFAVVLDSIRGDTFAWNSADLSTQVTNDPGQGITVPPASDPTGASGAWVRQWDGVKSYGRYWGIVGDATPTVDPWGLDLFNTTATGSSGQPVLTVASTTGILPGMRASGTGLSTFVGTFTSNNIVSSVNAGLSQITLSRNLIGNISGGTITFQGPVVGTGTDNSVALINWGKWARSQTSGSGYLILPPGTILWNGAVQSPTGTFDARNFGYGWRLGILNFTIEGSGGSILQNTYNQAISGANSATGGAWPQPSTLEINGYLINDTVIGNTFFTLQNLSDVAASGVYAGMVGYLACNDSQNLGYPPNPGQYEPFTVTSIVGNVINVAQAIKYVHKSNFPDYNATPGIHSSCGAARMWVHPDPAWQGRTIMNGVMVNLSPGMPQGFYITLSGVYIETNDYIGPGFSETICRDVVHNNPSPQTSGETDKFVDSITYNNSHGYTGGGYPFQSTCPNRLTFNGGEIASIVGLGKQTTLNNVKVALFQANAQFGMATSCVLNQCDVTSAIGTAVGNVIDGAKLNVIDGVNAVWANGFITLQCLTLIAAGSLNGWNAANGMWVNLQASTGFGAIFSNDLGTGFVQSITQATVTFGTGTATASTFPGNTVTMTSVTGLLAGMAVSGTGIGTGATIVAIAGLVLTLSVANTSAVSGTLTFTQPFITIETSLKQYATLPTWASGSIYFGKVNEVEMRHCIGDDSIRQMSAAIAANQRYFEYRRFEFGGINGQSMTVDMPAGAILTGVDVYVQTPSSVANAVLTLIPSTIQQPANSSSPYVIDSPTTNITIRLDIAGLRRITTTTWDGYPTGSGTLDHISVNGGASDFLPPNRLVGSTMGVQFFSQATSTTASPVGYVIMRFSAGLFRTPMSRQYDDNGSPPPSTTATGTVGVNTMVVASASGLSNGMEVTGGGVGDGATITNVAGTTITLSVVNAASFTAQPVAFSVALAHTIIPIQSSLP